MKKKSNIEFPKSISAKQKNRIPIITIGIFLIATIFQSCDSGSKEEKYISKVKNLKTIESSPKLKEIDSSYLNKIKDTLNTVHSKDTIVTVNVSGLIEEGDGYPRGIRDVNILIKNNNNKYFGKSKKNGKFLIKNVPLGKYEIEFSHDCGDYERKRLSLNLEKNQDKNLNVELNRIYGEDKKPVIYIYPEEETIVSVKLNYEGELLHTYPKYSQSGWVIKAEPDGTLQDDKGQEYYALFWEGKTAKELNASDGFVVKGSETSAFLEEKLSYLGLNRREANEFIMYWLPVMENNEYNFIHFAGEDYNQMAELKINPSPETIIRVMMLTKPLQHSIDAPLQDLSSLKKERKGFTVVEWGGRVINSIPF